MGLKIVHDGSGPGDPQEHCCLCRAQTRFWHKKTDVALCESCAKTAKIVDLPTKKEWIEKELKIMGKIVDRYGFLRRGW